MTKLEEAKQSIGRLEHGMKEVGEDKFISDKNKDLVYARVAMSVEQTIVNLFNPKVIEILRGR